MRRRRAVLLAWAVALPLAAIILSAAIASGNDADLQPRAFAPALACDSCAPAATPTQTASPGPTAWYTSSHFSAMYYYCSLDDGWRNLSPQYLRQYPTEAALLADWSGRRTKHPDSKC